MDAVNSTPPKKRAPWWIWPLLLTPYVALCFPQIYARDTPELFGFPFFYWYQFVWVVLTSTLLGVVYKQLKSR